MKIELLYFDGCPGYEELRPRLEELLDERGLRDRLQLVHVTTIEEAEGRRFLGSPTLLVDGEDVESGARGRDDYGIKCRVYQTSDGLRRLPDEKLIGAALDGARS